MTKMMKTFINSLKYELDTFQKKSVSLIGNNENILVTAPTGSGKSFCALAGIVHTLEQGKKVIYTSPIKSLSNQKFDEFKNKFKKQNINANIGIFTGDIKYNINNANVIIMTAEILRNILLKNDNENKDYLGCQLNIKKEIGCVIMDEVHYINDKERGKIWEQTLMLLDRNISLILLSATINNSNSFASWLKNIKNKECHIISKKTRAVPLNHYMYYNYNKVQKIRDQKERSFVDGLTNKLIPIQNHKNKYYQNNVSNIFKVQNKELSIASYFSNRHGKGPINELGKLLKSINKLPALFFVFSKRKTETFANQINLTFTTKQEQSEIRNIVKQKINSLQNKEIYDYDRLLNLWVKGVAYHHSGLESIYKELIEILASKKLIKIIFATETFSVGVNVPIKTVVFTSLTKHDGVSFRNINSTEYIQMAGRAGRRGLDKTGDVIILANYLNDTSRSTDDIRSIIKPKSQNISSKFNLDCQTILKLLLANVNIESFIRDSYKFASVRNRIKTQKKKVRNLKAKLDDKKIDFGKYLYLITKSTKRNKRDKRYINKTKKQEGFEERFAQYMCYSNELKVLESLENDIKNNEYNKLIEIMIKNNYITPEMKLTIKGVLASSITECNELILSELIYSNSFDKLDKHEICSVLGLLMSRSTKTEYEIEDIYKLNVSKNVLDLVNKTVLISDNCANEFSQLYIKKYDTELNFDLCEFSYRWSKGVEFKNLYYSSWRGNFIKDMVRLDNLIQTVEGICSIIDKPILRNKLIDLHKDVVRDIVYVQSLYVLN